MNNYTNVINLSEVSKTTYLYDNLQDCAPALSFFQFSCITVAFYSQCSTTCIVY